MKRTLLQVLFVYLFTNLPAVQNIAFKNLSTKEGLSNSQINHITRDSQGFMWICTSSGLNRYDGYTFKVFTRDSNNPNSLPDNFVEDIQEDAGGDFWVRTSRVGYVYYDSGKEMFHPADRILSARYGIRETPGLIYIDKEKNLWCHINAVGTYRCDGKDKNILFYPAGEGTASPDGSPSYITEDETGIILLYETGLMRYLNRKSPGVLKTNDYLSRIQGKSAYDYSMFVDSDGDYWVYTKSSTGLWVYYAGEDKWELCTTQANSHYLLSSNNISDVGQDNKGQIWITTDHGGINLVNKKLRTINYILNDPLDERSIVQNSLTCLYCDETGTVWIGSYKRGICYYNESIFKFQTDHFTDLNHIKNFAPDINVIAEDKNGNLWMGTNSSGVIFMDRSTKGRTVYQHRADRNSLSNNVVVSLLASGDGKIWIGTYQGGLNVFDGNTFTHYRHRPGNPNSLSNDNVWALAEGENGIIWIGTLGNGLQSLDPRTGTFTGYGQNDPAFANDFIASICVARDKTLLIGTSDGVTFFSPTTGKFEKRRGNMRGTQLFSHPNINQVYEDSRGLLWLATQEGLNIYDRKKDEVVKIDNDQLSRNEIIHAVMEDNNKNMWVTTFLGIFNITVTVDPKSGVYAYGIIRYNEQDGLQNQEFNLRSVIKTYRGEIIAGGVRGVSLFDPENIRYNYATPKVVFTGLQLFNEEVKIDSVYNGNRILKQALNQSSGVELKYRQNVFSVSFSSMNYVLPEKTKYSYMLEGFNTDLLIADGNKVAYTNLAPGKYTLRVKAINSDGFGNPEASGLELVIHPPFWLSPIAYIIYALLIIGILFLARRQILHSERNRYRLVRLEQEARQKHEIDDMKLRFFTNISHELRTPLTLIISPLENLLKETEDKEQKQKMEMIHRNAIRLLTMVNQLLDFRKSDVKGHQFNPSHGDIVEFVRNICTSFTGYSDKKNVHLTFFSDMNELTMVFDEDKMGKIIMNLLSNAFKFTPQDGRVDVYMHLPRATDTAGEKLEIRISDTGTGVKDEDKERIFERFYQVQHRDINKISGSGVGLHLVREFVTLHRGVVSVYDNAGQGSVFVVTLPVAYPQAAQIKATANMPAERKEETPENSRPVILIVDDNDDFRLFMKDSLKADYEIKEAANGTEAWTLIQMLQPDIIVSDVMMPEPDGNELCRLVKNDIATSHIPLILLTARSAEEQKLQGLKSGADDYITKPFSLDILSLRIKKLLQLRQRRQENFKKQIEINPSEITITSLDEKLIKKAIRYVEDNMGSSELSVEEMSRELGMGRIRLYKKLTSLTGKSPIEFIRIIRLKRAAQYLRESQLNVSEIAYKVGFNHPKHFRKYFKQEFGMLPSEYQEKEGK